MSRRGNLLGVALLALAVVGVQVLTRLGGREYYLVQWTMAAYTAVVVMGLGLVMGYAGQVSMGHAAFLAIGGYTSAVLTTLDLARWADAAPVRLLERLGVLAWRSRLYGQDDMLACVPWAAFVAALVLTAVVAWVVGYPALRLRGHYLAMATLGFGLIVYQVVLGSRFTGYADGISAVPAWHLVPGVTVGGAVADRVANYYVAWGLALLVLVLILNLIDSRLGRALRAIHGSERAAHAAGVDIARCKLLAFVLSALIAATAGSFLTHYTGGIGPSEAGVMKSVRYVALVAVGGAAHVWGGLVLGALLTFLSLRGCFGTFDDAVFGVALIAIMTLCPNGPLPPLWRALRRLTGRLARRGAKPREGADVAAEG